MKPHRLLRSCLVGVLGALTLVSPGRALDEGQFGATLEPVRTETLEVDGQAPGRPFPHYWERMFGSGRAILTLRQSYRRDLREVKEATGFEYVRFHAIFHDEVGVYDEDAAGQPLYNFSYVDQIYDGLLENGVRPFVELSFTPAKLAQRRCFTRSGTGPLSLRQKTGRDGATWWRA